MYKCGVCNLKYKDISARNKCEALCIARAQDEARKLKRELALKKQQEAYQELDAIRLEYETKAQSYEKKYYNSTNPPSVPVLNPVPELEK